MDKKGAILRVCLKMSRE